jgi:hypothetical protein
MNEGNGGYFFAAILLVAVISATFTVLAEEKKTNAALEKKCEAAGWTWLHDEAKCIMVKEVK